MKKNHPGQDQQVLCLRCRFLQITWEPSHPRGCKAMGFKSREWPCMEVLRNSGERCLMFQEKPKPKRDPEETDENLPIVKEGFSKIV